MATTAALLANKGHTVSGSDKNVFPPMSDFLAAEGIPILKGFHEDRITDELDLVVVGNVVSRGNPEIEAVLERRVRCCSLPEIVRDEFLWKKRPIVLAGTHGKTTTTAMTGWLLVHAGLDPTVLVGGIVKDFGVNGSSYYVGEGQDFVIEGDEYDTAFFDKSPKFLKYIPDIVVINNIEFDHADIYQNLDDVQLVYRRLVNLVPKNGLLLLGADNDHTLALRDVSVSPVLTFGFSNGADWQAYNVAVINGRTRFSVRQRGREFGEFELQLPGAHNVSNALGAIAVGAHRGLDSDALADGLKAFQGIKRRLEVLGIVDGVTIFDDFAHHPTAVRETLSALRSSNPSSRVWAVFEPRSASSCRKVFQTDFADAFGSADEVILAAVFRSDLPHEEQLSIEVLARELNQRGQQARAIPDVDDIVMTIINEHKDGDLVVLMSNGEFGGIHQKLLKALSL